MAKKISRTPRTAPGEGDVMEALGQMDRMGPQFQDPPDADTTPKGPTVADLQKQIEEMNKRFEAQDRAQMAMTSTPQTQTFQEQAPGDVDLKGLPDPVSDPEGHARELSTRIRSNIQAHQDYTARKGQADASQRQRADESVQALWEDFAVAYPEIAKNEDRVEFVASKVLKDAQKRGIDPHRYMFANSSRFIRDVADAFGKTFGTKTKPGTQDDDNDDDDEGRTGGVFGGLESGQGGVSEPRRREPGDGDMVKEMREMQRKSGFY